MRTSIVAIGVVVFVIGFGSAFLVGYLANESVNDDSFNDQEYHRYQVLTVVGMVVASVGIGVVTHGLVFGEHTDESRKWAKCVIVAGATVLALGFGTACWTALWIHHLEMENANWGKLYETLRLWSNIGTLTGLLGMGITVYGLAFDNRVRGRKRMERKGGLSLATLGRAHLRKP